MTAVTAKNTSVRTIKVGNTENLNAIKDTESFKEVDKKGEETFIAKASTTVLSGLFCAGACMAYMTIQRTAFGQPLLTKDLLKVGGVCGFKGLYLNLAKTFILPLIMPKKESTGKDLLELSAITALETLPGTYQDSLTAKNFNLPLIATLSFAKTFFGNATQTKTYESWVKNISKSEPSQNSIQSYETPVKFLKGTADLLSPSFYVKSVFNKLSGNKNYAISEIFDKEMYSVKSGFANKNIKDVFCDSSKSGYETKGKDVTIRHLIEKGLFKEDLNLSDILNKHAYNNGALNLDTPVKFAFKPNVKAKDVLEELAPLLEKENNTTAALAKLGEDVASYTLFAGMAALKTFPATVLNNEPLTPANFAKTFVLSLLGSALWNTATLSAKQFSHKILGDWAYKKADDTKQTTASA